MESESLAELPPFRGAAAVMETAPELLRELVERWFPDNGGMGNRILVRVLDVTHRDSIGGWGLWDSPLAITLLDGHLMVAVPVRLPWIVKTARQGPRRPRGWTFAPWARGPPLSADRSAE